MPLNHVSPALPLCHLESAILLYTYVAYFACVCDQMHCNHYFNFNVVTSKE